MSLIRKVSSLRQLVMLTALSVLAGCASLPEQLNAKSENPLTDYNSWASQTETYQQDVRLGGVIASVTNLKTQTRFELVNMPIDTAGRPDLDKEPNGRFVVYIDGFLDPVSWAPGRLVTVVGTASGSEPGLVGEAEYTMPKMDAYGYYLWRIEEWVAVDRTETYLDTCHGIHCTSLRMSPSRGRVIKEVK